MENNSMSRTRGLNRCQGKPIFKRRRTSLQFEDLPEDMLCTILSELPLKEVVRTSILSRKWRHLWTNCRKLRFDGVTMCGDNTCGSEQYTRKFIDNVNAVLQQHHGKEVEELEVIFEFESMLVNHLNNWVGFAVSSRTKSLAFDLVPAEFRGRRDRYIFPFELLDNDSIRRLQRIQLSFVSFKPPPQFSGFPNLRKLDLHLLYITRKDLENMLSNCFNLEWLSIVRCNLDGGLKVASPLPRLLYLHVVGCRITKIEFNAMKLTTFVYKGLQIPFDLGQALELKDADFYVFGSVTLEHALTALPNALPSVQNLTLRVYSLPLTMPWPVINLHKYSQLKHLRLFLLHFKDANNILSLASFLRAAPLIEKFEMHLGGTDFLLEEDEPIRSLGQCPYNYLKNVCITGFRATIGEIKFLVHTVENAPALEVLTIDITKKICGDLPADHEIQARLLARVRVTARRCLDGKISPSTILHVL